MNFILQLYKITNQHLKPYSAISHQAIWYRFWITKMYTICFTKTKPKKIHSPLDLLELQINSLHKHWYYYIHDCSRSLWNMKISRYHCHCRIHSAEDHSLKKTADPKWSLNIQSKHNAHDGSFRYSWLLQCYNTDAWCCVCSPNILHSLSRSDQTEPQTHPCVHWLSELLCCRSASLNSSHVEINTHSVCSSAGCCPVTCLCRWPYWSCWERRDGRVLHHCRSCRHRCRRHWPSLKSCWCHCCSSARWCPPRPAALTRQKTQPMETLKSKPWTPIRELLPRLMSSRWGSGDGLSLLGEVLGPAPGLMGARNCDDGWLTLADCCSIRAWILLLPSALTSQTTQ